MSYSTMIAIPVFGLMSLFVAGCDYDVKPVGRNQYLDTAYAPGPARPSTYRVGGEMEQVASPKFVVIRPAESGETISSATTSGSAATPPAAAGVAPGAEGLTVDRQRVLAAVNNDIDAMTTRLQQITTQAKIKGSASGAALDPHARAFNNTIDQLRGEIDNSRNATGDDWTMAAERIESLIKQARQTVDNAQHAVDAVPVVK